MKKEKLNYKTEEQKEIVKFGIVLAILVCVIVFVYLLSSKFLNVSIKEYEYTTGTVSTDVVIVGTLLNQKEKSYYVMAYDSTKNNATSYNTYTEYYTSNKKDALKIYYLDLNNGMNKDYYVLENSNPNAKKIKDLKIIDGTLIKVENNKITKYIEGTKAIEKELKVD